MRMKGKTEAAEKRLGFYPRTGHFERVFLSKMIEVKPVGARSASEPDPVS